MIYAWLLACCFVVLLLMIPVDFKFNAINSDKKLKIELIKLTKQIKPQKQATKTTKIVESKTTTNVKKPTVNTKIKPKSVKKLTKNSVNN